MSEELYIDPVKEAGGEDEHYQIKMFFNSCMETHKLLNTISTVFIGLRAAKEKGDTSRVNILENKFAELRAEHFPDQSDEELAEYLIAYHTWNHQFMDRHLSNDIFAEKLAKIHNNKIDINGVKQSLTIPMRPSVKTSMSLSDRMRRSRQIATGAPDSFTLVLLNSMVVLRIKQPSPLDMVRLINTIATTLNGYGARFNINSIMLERAGIIKLIMNFIYQRVTYYSVSDIVSAEELGDVITYNDANLIAMTLLGLGSPKGVFYNMRCLADKCNYEQTHAVNPYEMIFYYDDEMDEDRKIKLNTLIVKGEKLTKAEVLSYHREYKFDGITLDGIVSSPDKLSRVIIKPPLMNEAFQCFDYHADQINTEVRELAIQFPNTDVYRQKRQEYITCLRGLEYLHYIYAYEVDPVPGEEGETQRYLRSENPVEFDKGIIDVFNEDEAFYAAVIDYINRNAPLMTYTFIGIRNDSCPNCKAKAEGVVKGFTPIDPVTNFFDHTRGKIALNTMVGSLEEASLS